MADFSSDNYLTSSMVDVFPNAKRDTEASRTMCEERFTNSIVKITDVDGSFIISDTIVGVSYVEFFINGYYFKVDLDEIKSKFPSSSITSSTSIYANIRISNASNNEFRELNGQDDSSKYTGLIFTQGNYSAEATHWLLIFDVASDGKTQTWSLHENSKYKFSGKSLNFNVDGGYVSLS